MKISVPNRVDAATPAAGSTTSASINLDKVGNNWVGAVRVKLTYPNTSASGSAPWVVMPAQSRITHTHGSEVSTKGVRRIMMRVSMPYMALPPAGLAGESRNAAFSPSRSGREISVHTVITVPKEVYEDISQQRAGDPGVLLAEQQVFALVRQHLLDVFGLTVAGGSAIMVGSRDDLKVGFYTLQGRFMSGSESDALLDMSEIAKELATGSTKGNGVTQVVAKSPLLRGICGLPMYAADAAVGTSLTVNS